MEAVRAVKRLTRERRVGHGGALDPLAEGVLPILFGTAARVMEFLVDSPKVYRAGVVLGAVTDTYDATGTVLRQEDIEKALADFRGLIYQVPPMFSALKREGKRLYDLARTGVVVPRKPRKVQVFRLEIVEWAAPALTLEVECGRGMYIRALAHDIGQSLGCGAHLASLRRLRAGPFTAEAAVSLEGLRTAVEAGTWTDLLYSPDFPVLHLRAAVVGPQAEAALRHGQGVPLGQDRFANLPYGERCRVYTLDGRFLAIARYEKARGLWHPEKVLDLPS